MRLHTRRDVLRHAGSAAMFAAIASQVDFTRPAYANDKKLTGPINVLAWTGYDDPELIKGFKELTGVDVNVKEAQSNSDQLSLIRAGTTKFDIVNPDAVWTTKFAQSGLTLPLDPADIPSLGEMFPPFRDLADIKYDGKMYGAPTRFGMNGIVHDLDKLSAADAADANVLWDAKLKDRISIVNWAELYILMTALWQGNAKPETVVGPELEATIARLVEVKPNLRAIHDDLGSVKSDLINGDAWVVWGASSDNVARVAREAGKNVALTLPKQKGVMWMETLQIVHGTEHLASAMAYINYMTSAKALSIMAWGKEQFAVTNAGVSKYLTAEQYKLLDLDKIDYWFANSIMGKAPDDEKAWADAWEQFKAA